MGKGILSNPWSNVPHVYNAWRFLGKVWYKMVTFGPYGMHVGAPSMSSSKFALLLLPRTTGEVVETIFVVSMFLQQDIRDARLMNLGVIDAFGPAVMNFLNKEWVTRHCIWGVELDVKFQKLSLLEGVRLRGPQSGGGSRG